MFMLRLPNIILEVFHKSSYIESVNWEGYSIPRTLFIRNATLLSESEKNALTLAYPFIQDWFIEQAEQETFTLDNIMKTISERGNGIFKLTYTGKNSPRYLFKFNEEFAQHFIDLDMIESLPTGIIYGFINDFAVTGVTQNNIEDLCRTLYQIGNISEIKFVNIKSEEDFNQWFVPIGKYVTLKKNYLFINGNSGGGNITTYITHEEAQRRAGTTENLIYVSGSYRLSILF